MKSLFSIFTKKVYEFKIANIHDSYIKTQPLEYQKEGWEIIASSEPKESKSGGYYISVTLRRKIN